MNNSQLIFVSMRLCCYSTRLRRSRANFTTQASSPYPVPQPHNTGLVEYRGIEVEREDSKIDNVYCSMCEKVGLGVVLWVAHAGPKAQRGYSSIYDVNRPVS